MPSASSFMPAKLASISASPSKTEKKAHPYLPRRSHPSAFR
ncbi:hypothetical protein CORC01_05422 [Colletotrichum orchidophilum]|uniref:Uncharacterized protein n=1 Tax=Colletotrichum orchidophilum TaxID=1209926 RepID=A0A1G4BDB5_9PEZI|nr:uncharacterized protein CORC01_05422 [Colletotrichum orchidophilum]OHE99381.1 hypothetical protein CORC01_05422 [Colletotrichum orchidophilum]